VFGAFQQEVKFKNLKNFENVVFMLKNLILHKRVTVFEIKVYIKFIFM